LAERIDVTVTGITEIDIYIAKLNEALSKEAALTGVTPSRTSRRAAQKKITDWQRFIIAMSAVENQNPQMMELITEEKLPGINREMRLILGQVPGMHQVIRQYFNIKRLQRGVIMGGLMGQITLLATAVVLLQLVLRRQKEMERQRKQYEDLIRGYYAEWTHKEYESRRRLEDNALRGRVPI